MKNDEVKKLFASLGAMSSDDKLRVLREEARSVGIARCELIELLAPPPEPPAEAAPAEGEAPAP